jgi:hypothetical protein
MAPTEDNPGIRLRQEMARQGFTGVPVPTQDQDISHEYLSFPLLEAIDLYQFGSRSSPQDDRMEKLC